MACRLLPTLDALGIDIQGIQRLGRRHKQAVAVKPAETHIGTALGQGDTPNRGPIRREDDHSVQLFCSHAPATPEVAIDITTHAIRCAPRPGVDQDPFVAQFSAICRHIVRQDLAMRDSPGLDHVQERLVWRKAEPVGAEDIVRHDAGLSRLTVETVDMLPHFRGGL